ncbi:MAG: NUDIX hydrolase [Sinobacteraceae bacterium]|nr:NUDIX hydrolase [Nevskiaceae bacterium]
MLIRSREVFTGRVTRLTVDTVDLPNGHRADLEVLHHPGGAAVVAVDGARQVCLLRQYRHAAGGYVIELPAGRLEPDEAPARTAERELAEEAGRHAACWRDLGVSLSSPGVFTERIYLYLATELTPVPDAPEAAEVFEVLWVPLAEAVQRCLRGDIEDSKTCLGILRAAAVLAQMDVAEAPC